MTRLLGISAACLAIVLLLAFKAARSAEDALTRDQLEPGTADHWSFVPPVRPEVPTVANPAWARNPIDAFIHAGLAEAGLKPAPPADKARLLRRVYLDVIGLPPAPAELDAFLADDSPTAFERVVDDLLSRPQYGERWARHWLDVVRYAESNGYERDLAKPSAWKFRDWVIQSLNADMPYDQFLTEQLAGDEVPGSNARSQLGATMLRLGPWDDEPADPVADRYDQLDDIVATTSAAFLGMTLRCARCHDHKFEPLSQKDYTRWLAIFAPLKRSERDRTEFERDLGPHEEVAAHQALVARLDKRKAELEEAQRTLAWQVATRAAAEGRLPVDPPPIVLAATSQQEPQTWRYTFDPPADSSWLLPDYPAIDWKTGPGGFGTHGTAGAVVRTVWNTAAIWLRREFTFAEQPTGELKLVVQHDEDFEVYLNGVPAASSTGFVQEYRVLNLGPAVRNALRPGRNVLAVHCKHGSGGQAIDVGLIAVPQLNPEQVSPVAREIEKDALVALVTDPAKRNDDQKKLLAKHADKSGQLVEELATAEEQARISQLRAELDSTSKAYPAPLPKGYVWYEEGPEFGETHLFDRGDPRSPRDVVAPGFPAVLLETPPALPTPTKHSTGRRLQLARWLTSANHPLTARVMVNRLWQHHFGEGIVATENDFGVMGAMPSNQPLLDWLASEFVAGGWRMKRMHRLMLLSQAYQMSSAPNAEAQRVDPSGELLWRFRPRRVEAETLRDAILAASGQLNLTGGGPGVYPKISREVLETQSQPGNGWGQSSPAEASRRSVYVFVKRTLLVPELEVLDFPSTEQACEQRVVSTVAPQALTFLNGEFIHEQAQAFAGRLLAEAGLDSAAQVERAYRIAFSREPAEKERQAVLMFLEKQRAQILADAGNVAPEDAQRRALAALCLVLLNTNEFAYLQ